jgi:hypothetical protein
METHRNLEDAVILSTKKPLARKITAFLLHWGIETHGYVYGQASSFVLIQTPHGGITQNLAHAVGGENRQAPLSNVFRLVLGELQHLSFQHWIRWPCFL